MSEEKLKVKKLSKKKTIKNSNNIFDNVPSLMSLIIPETIEEKKDKLYLGTNRYTRNFVLTVYPSEIYLGWLDELFNIGEITLSILSESAYSGDVIRQLTQKVTALQSEYMVYENQGNIYHLPELENMIVDYEEMRKLIQTQNDKLFYVTILISLHCKSEKELDDKSEILENELSKKSAQLRTLTFRQIDAFKTILPLNDLRIKDFNKNLTAARIFSIISYSLS